MPLVQNHDSAGLLCVCKCTMLRIPLWGLVGILALSQFTWNIEAKITDRKISSSSTLGGDVHDFKWATFPVDLFNDIFNWIIVQLCSSRTYCRCYLLCKKLLPAFLDVFVPESYASMGIVENDFQLNYLGLFWRRERLTYLNALQLSSYSRIKAIIQFFQV